MSTKYTKLEDYDLQQEDSPFSKELMDTLRASEQQFGTWPDDLQNMALYPLNTPLPVSADAVKESI